MMATPTFFAGACIVLAAILAYGTTQTHLVFSGGHGSSCAAASCTAAGPVPSRVKDGGVPPATSARPATSVTGAARATASPGAAGHAPAGGTNAAAGPNAAAGQAPPMTSGPGAGAKTGSWPASAQARASSPGLPVIITYRTVRRYHGGFLAAMTITSRSASAIPNWLLWLRYPQARIQVWGARWYPAGPRAPGAGVVAPRLGQLVLWPGASARFTFWASGHAGPPPVCFFDTARCSFR